MAQEFKVGDKVRIRSTGDEGVIIKCNPVGMKVDGEGATPSNVKVNGEDACRVKLDIKDKQGKNVQEWFSVNELEKLS